jgi:hypothetical protein
MRVAFDSNILEQYTSDLMAIEMHCFYNIWTVPVASVTVQVNQVAFSGDKISGAAHFTSIFFFSCKW